MRVRIETPGSLDTDSFEWDDGGVCSVPLFYGAGRDGTVAIIRVMDVDGKVIQAAKLNVSGVDGKLSLQNRSAPSKPACEREPESLEATLLPPKGK